MNLWQTESLQSLRRVPILVLQKSLIWGLKLRRSIKALRSITRPLRSGIVAIPSRNGSSNAGRNSDAIVEKRDPRGNKNMERSGELDMYRLVWSMREERSTDRGCLSRATLSMLRICMKTWLTAR